MAVPKKFRLATIGGICTELKRLYRMGHDGELGWQDAVAASRVLRELRFCIEGDGFEQRLEALEQALDVRDGHLPKRAGNGHARDRGRHHEMNPR